MNKPVSVLIVNVHSTCNAGDLALLEVTAAQAARAFPGARITAAANYPSESYYLNNPGFSVVLSPWGIVGEGQGLPVWKKVFRLAVGASAALAYRAGARVFCPPPWKELFQAYESADLVIGVAGNQFYSTGRFGWPLPANAFAVELAHLFGKPFYTMPQSIGPFKRGWERAVMRRVYGKANRLFFREMISLQLAEKIGIPPQKAQYAPDPAFGFPAAPPEEARRLLGRYSFDGSAPSIGMTLIAPMGHSLNSNEVERYYRAMTALVQRMVEYTGARVYFFNQVVGPSRLEDDRTAVRRVMAALGSASGQAVWVDEILPPALLKACYGCMDFFIASRLHSGIFSLAQNVPTLLIGYLTKTRGVLRAIGLEDWVIDLGEIQEDRLISMAVQAWQEREARAAALAERMPGVIAESEKTMELIAEAYERTAHPGSAGR